MFGIQFIDSFCLLPTALSSLAELINYDKLGYKCGECKHEWEEPFEHKLTENFPSVYEY